jgi:hypothetical protein
MCGQPLVGGSLLSQQDHSVVQQMQQDIKHSTNMPCSTAAIADCTVPITSESLDVTVHMFSFQDVRHDICRGLL